MDFEYRIFKFVPQVDRFVNEQMQFKLQECSYNKASTFEIDDDYADDYDFGLYQGDRSKARKHADNLIYKLCENQEYSIDEKEHMINMLVRDIERYILTTQLNSAQSDKHVKRLLKALLAVDKDLDVITIVCKYYQECMEYLQEVSYASIIKIDYKDLYIHAGDRALFIKNDYELALKFYELSELDWDGGEIKQQDIIAKYDNEALKFIVSDYRKISEAINNYESYMEISDLVENFLKNMELGLPKIKQISQARSILMLMYRLKKETMPYLLCRLSEEDDDSKKSYVESVIKNVELLKSGPMKIIAEYTISQKGKDKNQILEDILILTKTVNAIQQIKQGLLVKEVDDDVDIAYYTSIDNLFLMLPCKAKKKEYIGKLAIMNISYMNDPNEGKTLQKFLYGKEIERTRGKRRDVRVPYVFLKCFTTQIDYLPMWEMYADHAEGCCIVINWNKIRQYNTEKSVPLYRVLYLTENSGEYAITRTKNPHIKEFTRVKQYLNVLKDNAVLISTRKEALNIFGKLLSDIIYLFKDSSYSYEQEMRIIYSYDSVSDVFMHTETKYPLLFVYPDFPLQIEEIILAPKFIDRTRKIPYIQEQIEKMCDYIGGDMPIITNSNIDYR